MSVTTPHPDYDCYTDAWKRRKNTLAGRDTIIHGTSAVVILLGDTAT